MPNFGLPLLLNWRLLRKTSYLKIKGLCGKSIYNLQKKGVEQTQKQGDTAAKKRVAEQRADRGNNCRDTPLRCGYFPALPFSKARSKFPAFPAVVFTWPPEQYNCVFLAWHYKAYRHGSIFT